MLQLWLFQILVWIKRRVSNAVEARIWSYCTFSKHFSAWGRFSSMMTIKQNIDLDLFPRMTWEQWCV